MWSKQTTEKLDRIATSVESIAKKVNEPVPLPPPTLDGATEMWVLKRSCADSTLMGNAYSYGIGGISYFHGGETWDYVTPDGKRTSDLGAAARFPSEKAAMQKSVDLTPFNAKTTKERRDTGLWKVSRVAAKWVEEA